MRRTIDGLLSLLDQLGLRIGQYLGPIVAAPKVCKAFATQVERLFAREGGGVGTCGQIGAEVNGDLEGDVVGGDGEHGLGYWTDID